MINDNYLEFYNKLKRMTIEDIISLFDMCNNKQKKEDINQYQEEDSKKIIYTTNELIENYAFFTRYNINRAIEERGLPYFIIGNKRMFNKNDIDKWLDKESKSRKTKQKYDI